MAMTIFVKKADCLNQLSDNKMKLEIDFIVDI